MMRRLGWGNWRMLLHLSQTPPQSRILLNSLVTIHKHSQPNVSLPCKKSQRPCTPLNASPPLPSPIPQHHHLLLATRTFPPLPPHPPPTTPPPIISHSHKYPIAAPPPPSPSYHAPCPIPLPHFSTSTHISHARSSPKNPPRPQSLVPNEWMDGMDGMEIACMQNFVHVSRLTSPFSSTYHACGSLV